MRTLAFLAVLIPAASLATPVTLSHSGYLLDASDRPATADLPATLRLFDASSGGSEVWAGSCTLHVAGGYYATTLGDTCGPGLDTTLVPPDATRWLQLTVDGAVLLPRVAILPAAAAVRALDADLFGGHDPAWYADASHLTGTIARSVLPLATPALPGALAAADKAKLDAIGAGATVVTVSGVAPVAVTGGANPQVSVPLATTGAAGLLSALDKAKLDSLTSGAAVASVGGVAPVSVTGGLTPQVSVPAATGSSAGLMSAADKTKLDALGGTGMGVASTGTSYPASPVEGTIFFNTASYTLEVFSTGAWRFVLPPPSRSCSDLRRAGFSTSGTYTIDPDGAGPGSSMTAYCDMTSDGGGWTMVFRATTDNYNDSGIGYISGLSGTDSVVSRSTEMLFAFVDSTAAATPLTQAWKFPTPSVFHSVTPMASTVCGYATITATRLADSTSITRKLRYGVSSFGSLCDENCSGTWGQICLKSSDTPGVGGGYSDFPHYATYVQTTADHCSRSDQAYTTTSCSSTRRFAIFVR